MLQLAGLAAAQTDMLFIRPQEADSATSAGEPHIVATAAGPVRAPLALFLPGTGAIPAQYQLLARTIAGWGMPVLSLNYPNPLTVNTVCAVSLSLNCYEDVRTEIFTGDSRSSLVTVSRADSIEFRVLRLLQWLHRQAPARGWNQFFEGDRVWWHRIVVSGHSQGGGHAGFIAKKVRTARAVMFAAMDYNELQRRVAPWMEQPGATPPTDFFALGHERDELVSYNTLSQRVWPALSMEQFGAPLPIGSASFGTVRTLRMDQVIGVGTAHSLVAADTAALLPAATREQLERAWRHLYQGASAVAVNAAGYQSATLAPTSIVAIYASGIRADRTYDARVGSRLLRVFAVAANQVNAILPAVPLGTAWIEIRDSTQVWTGPVEIRATAPGIFTRDFSGQGEVAAIWTSNVLTIFGTGWRGSNSVRATLGGELLDVQYSGAQPEFEGLDQMNLLVPRSLGGRVGLDLRIEVEGVAANPVKVSVPAL